LPVTLAVTPAWQASVTLCGAPACAKKTPVDNSPRTTNDPNTALRILMFLFSGSTGARSSGGNRIANIPLLIPTSTTDRCETGGELAEPEGFILERPWHGVGSSAISVDRSPLRRAGPNLRQLQRAPRGWPQSWNLPARCQRRRATEPANAGCKTVLQPRHLLPGSSRLPGARTRRSWSNV
jgi:hypothetical protein